MHKNCLHSCINNQPILDAHVCCWCRQRPIRADFMEDFMSREWVLWWCAISFRASQWCERWFRFAPVTSSLFVYHKPARNIEVISSPQLNAIVARGLTLQDSPRHVFGPPAARRCVFGPRSEVFQFKKCLGHPQAINPKMNGKQPEICEAHLARCEARLRLVYNGLYMIAICAW